MVKVVDILQRFIKNMLNIFRKGMKKRVDPSIVLEIILQTSRKTIFLQKPGFFIKKLLILFKNP
jgi:hypothetical protein